MIEVVKKKLRLQSGQAEALAASLPGETNLLSEEHHCLACEIVRRIEDRIPGRIRQLAVETTDNAIVLSGCCSTYYTKQVAQHAAMGVLEYERLINNIAVETPRP